MDGLKTFTPPKNDNEALLNFQAEAREGNPDALADMYELGKRIALKMINKTAEGNPCIKALCPEIREEKAHNAIVYIIARFLSVPGFSIRQSFTGYIFLRVRHELFYHTKADENIIFIDADTALAMSMNRETRKNAAAKARRK